MKESILRASRRLLVALEKKLKVEERDKISDIEKCRRSRDIVMEYIREMNTLIEEPGFRNEKEEIEFFKVVAPKFHSRYFYFCRLLEIEEDIFTMEGEERKEYLNSELAKLEKVRRKNACKYDELRHAMNGVASHFYLRSNDKGTIPHFFAMILSKSKCTSNSVLLSTWLANDKLVDNFRKKIKRIR